VIGPACQSRSVPVGRQRAGRASARRSRSAADLGVRSSGGSVRWVSAIERAVLAPYSAVQESQSQSGVFSRAASWLSARTVASPASRRSTALISEACVPARRLCARPTVVCTAACAGVRRKTSCATPRRSRPRTATRLSGSGRARQASINASICPSRRSIVEARFKANARSLAGSMGRISCASIASATGRRRNNTASTASRASRRAGWPAVPTKAAVLRTDDRRRAELTPKGRPSRYVPRARARRARGSRSRDGW
jgi:hypothetical protein